ncbi:unnamed protein product, partial [Discosporangium mesarthrocarpum]
PGVEGRGGERVRAEEGEDKGLYHQKRKPLVMDESPRGKKHRKASTGGQEWPMRSESPVSVTLSALEPLSPPLPLEENHVQQQQLHKRQQQQERQEQEKQEKQQRQQHQRLRQEEERHIRRWNRQQQQALQGGQLLEVPSEPELQQLKQQQFDQEVEQTRLKLQRQMMERERMDLHGGGLGIDPSMQHEDPFPEVDPLQGLSTFSQASDTSHQVGNHEVSLLSDPESDLLMANYLDLGLEDLQEKVAPEWISEFDHQVGEVKNDSGNDHDGSGAATDSQGAHLRPLLPEVTRIDWADEESVSDMPRGEERQGDLRE